MKLARNFYKSIDDAKLNTVNKYLGYEFKHHDALYDALACSNILLNISEELKCKDINEISELIGVTIGSVERNVYQASSTKGKALRTSSRIYNPKKENKFESLNKDGLKKQVVVFTGGLNSMTREVAMGLVRRLGGSTGSSVTKNTTILVTNLKDIKDLRREEMSNKLKRAIDLNSEGQVIKFLDEEEFLKIVSEGRQRDGVSVSINENRF
jgi:DNA polymerase-3 subunit epsilon